MFHKSLNRVGSLAAIVVSGMVLASAGSEFLHREIGGVALLVVAQSAVAAAIFLSAVLANLGDRETLSLYKGMRGR